MEGEQVSYRIEQLLDKAALSSSYDVMGTKMTLAHLRQWLEYNKGRRHWVRANVPNSEAFTLANSLSSVLDRFTNSDTSHIGFTPYDVIGGIVVDVTLDDIVKSMVSAAAILGSHSVVASILGWAAGNTETYVRTWVLRGVDLPEHLELRSGIRFETLPDRIDSLSQFGVDWPTVNVTELQNQPVLRMNVVIDPMFYEPNSEEDSLSRINRLNREAVTIPRLLNINLDDMLDAVSLVCRSSVQVVYEWNEFKDEMLLMRHAGSPSLLLHNISRFDQKQPDSKPLTADRLRRADIVMDQMNGRTDLKVAVSRWKNSAVALDAANRVIDLRTVLESLYAGSSNQELRFRTALCGALHLATSPCERTTYYDKFRELYDLASRVVHGNDSVTIDDELMKWTFEASRRAILKRLEEPRNLDWKALMLGLL